MLSCVLLASVILAACQLPAAGTSTPSPTAPPPPTAPSPPPPPATAAPLPPAPSPTGPATAASPGVAASPTGPAAGPSVAASPAVPAGPPASPSPAACDFGPTRRIAELQDRGVKEASGLAASRRTPGIYWTLNDSGNAPTVFAFDQQGRARGTFRVEQADNDDWESLQAGPGADGSPALYIGDLGDNEGERREVVIYRVPEPEPAPPDSKPGTRSTAPAEAFKLTYPGGPRNTEAMLVHPQTGEIVLITKEPSGRSMVFRVPLPLDSRRTVRVEQVGAIDTKALVPPGGLVVDAAVSADARRVAVRTYGNVLEYDVPDGAPLASIWSQVPRVATMSDGLQTEGVTYRADGGALFSIAEGSPALLYETPRQC